MRNDKYMTDLDKLSIYKATKERLEIQLGLRPSHKISGMVASLETLEDILKRDEQREEDGFSKKVKFKRILVDSGKVIIVPYVEEGQLAHGEFEPKHIVGFGQFFDNDDDIKIGRAHV